MVNTVSGLSSVQPGFSSTKEEKKAEKKNAPAYNIENLGFQNYLPVGNRRKLTDNEIQAVNDGLEAWWPKIAPGYNTKITEMIASPTKVAAIQGGLVGVITGGATGLVTGLTTIGKKIGDTGSVLLPIGVGLVGGIIGAISGFFGQRKDNEDALDLMHRMPPGATKRDLLSDVVYNQETAAQRLGPGVSLVDNIGAGAGLGIGVGVGSRLIGGGSSHEPAGGSNE